MCFMLFSSFCSCSFFCAFFLGYTTLALDSIHYAGLFNKKGLDGITFSTSDSTKGDDEGWYIAVRLFLVVGMIVGAVGALVLLVCSLGKGGQVGLQCANIVSVSSKSCFFFRSLLFFVLLLICSLSASLLVLCCLLARVVVVRRLTFSFPFSIPFFLSFSLLCT